VAVAVVDVQVNSQSAVRNLQQINGASKAATAGIGALRGAVASLGVALSAAAAIRFVVVKTAELETQTRSIQTLTGSVDKAKQIISELQAIGAVTPFTSTELIETAKRLTAFGVSADKVVETTRRLGDVAGATGANLGELSLAYGQVIAKGRLQGEELLQFQERGVGLQDELRKMYGLTGEEFSKALSKGRISAEAVEVAIVRLTEKGGKYANGAIAQSDTLAGKFSTLTDGVETIARVIGTSLTPAIKSVLNEAIFAINTINNLLNTGARARAFGLNQGQRQQILRQAQREAEDIVNRRRIRDPFERNRQFQELASQRERDLIEAFGLRTGQVKPTVTAPAATTKPPALLAEEDKGAAAKAKREEEKRKREAERAAQQIALSSRSLGVAQQEFIIQQRLLTARKNNNQQLVLAREAQKDLLAISAQGTEILANKDLPAQAKANQIAELRYKAKERALRLDEDLFKLQEEQAKKDQELIKAGQGKLQTLMDEEALLRAKLNGNEAEVILQQQLRDLMKDTKGLSEADVKAKLQGIEALKKQIAAADQMKQLYLDIGSTIKDGVVDAIQGAIDGTKSLGDVASQVLRSISAKLIDVGVNLALFGSMTGSGTGGGLLGMVGLGGKRAMGGSVSSGRSYLVGERGPELFTPGRSGGIAPSGTFGATNVVVNVDASGSSVQGDAGSGAALGRVIAAAVQSELVKQKRPGGILA
jgi:tape measure domain-containing protein